MAIAATKLTSGQDSDGGNTATTASVTPTANNLLLLTVTSKINTSTEPNDATATGNGLTWEKVNSSYHDTGGTSRKKTTLLRSMGASPSAGAITIAFGGENQDNITWSLSELSGVDTSGTNGSGAIVQSANNKQETGGTSLTVTLAAFSSTSNATWGSFGSGGGSGVVMTAGTGFTLIDQVNSGTTHSQGTEFRVDNDTTVNITTDIGTSIGGIAVEVKAAPVASTVRHLALLGIG